MSERDAEELSKNAGAVRGDSDWEDIADEDFERDEEEYPDLPPLPADGVSSSTWHKDIIAATETRSTSDLDALLERAVTERHSILNYAEDMIAAVGQAISAGNVSPDLESSLEMLMYLIVEHGVPAELMICFVGLFDRDEVNGREIEFFLPNMQGTVMRLQKNRLYWLTATLAQIDCYAGRTVLNEDEDWANEFDKIIHIHNVVCDFASPFVDEVRTDHSDFPVVKFRGFTSYKKIGRYRQCLARALLHLLATPLGIMPVSFAAGFASYQRVVALLGKIVPDFTVFIRWYEADHQTETSGKGDGEIDQMKIPIGVDSIARLAYLVTICEVEPSHFPSVLTAEYYLLNIILPCSECHGRFELQQHLHHLNAVLDEIPDRSLDETIVPYSSLTQHISEDLLSQAVRLDSEKTRKRIYLAVQRLFDKASHHCLHAIVRAMWVSIPIQRFPTVMEVLIMAVKKPTFEHLRSHSVDRLSRSQYLDLFKLFLSMTEYNSLADWSGLISCCLGYFTVVIALDSNNETGIRDILPAVEAYGKFWRKAVVDNENEIREELWKRTELDRFPTSNGTLNTSVMGELPVEEAGLAAKQNLNYTNILVLALDGLSEQIGKITRRDDRHLSLLSPTAARPLVNRSRVFASAPFVESDSLTAEFKKTPHTQLAGGSDSKDHDSTTSSSDYSSSDEYTSSDYSSDETGETQEAIREKILRSALDRVAEFGWSTDALAEAARSHGLPAVSHGLFPNGGLDIIIYAYEKLNKEYAETFKTNVNNHDSKAFIEQSFEDLIKESIQARLLLIPDTLCDLPTWSLAVGQLALPQNIFVTHRLVAQFVDEIWYLSGDRSVDSSWYAKRIALAAVYQVTEFHWLQDQSVDFEATWAFLDRRVRDFMCLHNTATKVRGSAEQLFPFLTAASTTIANLSGLNRRRAF